MEEARRRAQSLLSSSGQAQDVKTDVQTMANASLPLSEKYLHIRAEGMLRDNTSGSNKQEVLECLGRLVKALGILEKYGCNLTSPTRPKYWRSVKHNNPVFRTTVDAVKGGRSVLYLYGYTNQQVDGLSFPDDVNEPDVEKVAAVTLEVMTLRTEVDMVIKDIHPHTEHFKDIIPFVIQQKEEIVSDAVVTPKREELLLDVVKPPSVKSSPIPAPRIKTLPPPKTTQVIDCNFCGGSSMFVCPSCNNQYLCEACDALFHQHPLRATHKRNQIHKPKQETCTICGNVSVHAHCSTCDQKLCQKCDHLYHSHPDRVGHKRTIVVPPQTRRSSMSSWECSHCTTVNEMRAVLCTTCERPRLATPTQSPQEPPTSMPSLPNAEWQCKSCTMVNRGSSVLCEACERPRLAIRPPPAPALTSPVSLVIPVTKWTCQVCTFENIKPGSVCEVCNSCKDSGASVSLPPPNIKIPPVFPKPLPRVDPDVKRQRAMSEDGRNLINQIKEAEKRGVSPEEVYAALSICGGSTTNPCDWLNSELPHLLDEICAMAASVQLNYNTKDHGIQAVEDIALGVKLSRAEAKCAWMAAGGDTDGAVRQLLRDRQNKMRELQSMGFRDVSKCEEALRQSGGEVKGALSLLQRPLLEQFHQRIWTNQPEPPINLNDPDKQRTCRRLLALYELPSWGRCELVLSLLQESEGNYNLEDVVQAVKESADREVLKRLLQNECQVCLYPFPLSKMRSLTSCQCSLCLECFQTHFTIAVRDKHIRDMVCPACNEPDINDPEQLDNYFSTLDIQLRTCLSPDVYNLFHKKLTEHTLMKDPKFLWCCHCTFGFINEVDQLKVTCPTCHKSFCCKCKKPWEPQHQDVTCDQFQQWKRDNDPEYQKQGLAGFLRDNGITCPNCRFQYALTKGGCIHFTCSQCRYEFCSGCNNPFHKTNCKTAQCNMNGLHAHHPRDCLFYLRDWEAAQLQALLKRSNVEFNTGPSAETQTDRCGVMEQKDSGQVDQPCGVETRAGQAGLCDKHYREYLVSLINFYSLDPAVLYEPQDLRVACQRYQVNVQRADNESDNAYHARLLKKLMEVPLGDKVPRNQ